MNSVILSIKPEYLNAIIKGEKDYEFRRKIWKNQDQVKKVYLYATSPVKKIKGYFIIDKILKGTPEALWQHCQDEAGISKDNFFKYFEGISLGFAIRIGVLGVYRIGKEPEEFIPNFKRAPQSFMYFNDKIHEISISRKKINMEMI